MVCPCSRFAAIAMRRASAAVSAAGRSATLARRHRSSLVVIAAASASARRASLAPASTVTAMVPGTTTVRRSVTERRIGSPGTRLPPGRHRARHPPVGRALQRHRRSAGVEPGARHLDLEVRGTDGRERIASSTRFAASVASARASASRATSTRRLRPPSSASVASARRNSTSARRSRAVESAAVARRPGLDEPARRFLGTLSDASSRAGADSATAAASRSRSAIAPVSAAMARPALLGLPGAVRGHLRLFACASSVVTTAWIPSIRFHWARRSTTRASASARAATSARRSDWRRAIRATSSSSAGG